MTEGQLRYQTLMENQRHNIAVERLGEREASIKSRETAVKEAKLPQELQNLEQQEKVLASQWIGSGFQGAKLFTEALKNFIGTAGSVVSLFA